MAITFLLICLIPVVFSAQEFCKNGKEDCPQGTQCCFLDGKFSCCDENDPSLQETDASTGFSTTKNNYYSNNTIIGMSQNVDLTTCTGVWCRGSCCDAYTCCPNAYCCPNKYCCQYGLKCCGNGAWCCKARARCGVYYNTCVGAGSSFTPSLWILSLLSAALFTSKKLI